MSARTGSGWCRVRAVSALLGQVADKRGLTRALSEPDGGHDRGRVLRDLAVMFAAVWAGASTSTASRVVQIVSPPGLLDALRDEHGRAQERVWQLAGRWQS